MLHSKPAPGIKKRSYNEAEVPRMILEAIPSSENETNPWVSAEARFDEAAELL
jgi:hypothetical protein